MFTMMIFQSIAIDMEWFAENYLLCLRRLCGGPPHSVPRGGKKSIVENFAPILAKIFSPLFFLTLTAFLGVMVVTGRSPFAERDFLIGFDLMLVLVLGMVLYTISAWNLHDSQTTFDYLNVALITAAVIVDTAALWAILHRLSEHGITPNKLAALGENVLLLVNLVALLVLYVRYFLAQIDFKRIEAWQTRYLNIYAVWLAIVAFIFPPCFPVSVGSAHQTSLPG